MPKVVVTQPLLGGAVDRLTDAGFEVDAYVQDGPIAPEQLRTAVRDADALVCLLSDRVDARLLHSAPSLRVVANVAVGYDNIDVAAATAAGVAVANTPDVLTDATADLAFALLLSVARRVPEGDAFLRAGSYGHWKLDQEQLGLDVFGQTLGLYGFGRIGRAMAHRARHGFNMRVCYCSRRRLDPDEESRLGVRHVDFDELLTASDFISVHAPLSPDTRHRFDAAAFVRMKPSAVLINTARGPIVDEAALADALRDGTLWGAGLDVYEHEPAVHPRLVEQRERLVLLPHLGSATRHTRERMVQLAVDAVIAVLNGEAPSNLVNAEGLTGTRKRV